MKLLSAVVFVFLVEALDSVTAQSSCPKDKPLFNCFADPCMTAKCGQGTTCVSNYCGGCNAQCVPDTGCTPNKPPVYCFAEPCSVTTCPTGTKCVADYCGGCNANCEPECNQVICAMYCEFGFKKDPKGCDICQCETDPCANVKCGNNEVCKGGQCVGTGCTYFGTQYNVGDPFNAVDSCNTCTCSAGGAIACTEMYCPKCYYNSISYNPGASFPSTDGCNTCTCSDTGAVGCTKKACICPLDKPYQDCQYNPCIAALCIQGTTCIADHCGGCFAKCVANNPPSTCTYNGKTYTSGENFPSTDGCNDCSCNNGNVACTEKACVTCSVDGKVYQVGDSFPASDGCNTCTCSDNGFPICTLIACHQCPLYKCKACTTGHVYDADGCKTCQCNDPSCEGVQCRKGYFCSGAYCCPDRVKTMRCSDPCYDMNCGWFGYCKRYCNCYAKCEWYPWLPW